MPFFAGNQSDINDNFFQYIEILITFTSLIFRYKLDNKIPILNSNYLHYEIYCGELSHLKRIYKY